MSELAGFVNQVWILAGTVAMTNSTGAHILGVDNFTFTELCTLLEIPAFGGSHMRRLAGLRDTTMSFSGNVITTNPLGQGALVPGASIFIGAFPSGTTVPGRQIPAIVEEFSVSAEVAGKQTFSCTIASNGAPVTLPARA